MSAWYNRVVGRSRFKRISREQLKWTLREGWREYRLRDLRWSYFAVLILTLIGGVVNVLFAHGWTVWPFVLAAGILLMIHEAVDRNGQGIPPMYAYARLCQDVTPARPRHKPVAHKR